VSRTTEAAYGFADSIPLDPVPPGTSLLVAGEAFSPAEDLARSMVTCGADADEAVLFVSTGMTARRLLAACRQRRPSLGAARVGVVDCTGQDRGGVEDGMQVRYVSTQSDLTGIGMKFSALYESLYGDAVGGRVRTGLVSLSSLAMYVDLRTLFQFAQTLRGRVDAAGGLGVYTVDPSTHDETSANTLNQVADGRIEVRETDGEADGDLRVRGLHGRSDEWRPFSLP
jgi:KaiC/GvpD/RAD55 family RecA-like ATPase